jgi:parvulin-like peptidyl-prolyl isomerase
MPDLHFIAEIFDIRLRLFALMSSGLIVNNILADAFDMAGKAGTLPMQALMIVCIVVLGSVIVWQNKNREQLNRDRHKENQTIQEKLLTKLDEQQAAIDNERKVRIERLMDQQRDDIEAKKELAFSLRELATSNGQTTRVISDLERVVHKLVDHLELRERESSSRM